MNLILKNIIFIKFTFLHFFKQKDFIKYFIFIYMVYFLGYFALMINNINYSDDYYRSATGQFDFFLFSRYMSEYLSKFIYLSEHRNVLASPLTHLLSIGLLSIGSMVLVKVILKKYSKLGLIASVILGLSPYFLENMSYKFDSIFMTIALVAPIFSFLFLRRKLAFIFVSILCMQLTLTTYQAGNSAFLMLSLFAVLDGILAGRKPSQTLKLIGVLIFSYVCAFLIYRFFVMQTVDNYTSNEIFSLGQAYEGIKGNLERVYEYYRFTFRKTVFVSIFIAGVLMFFLAAVKTAKINKILAAIFTICFIVLGLLLSYGAYLILVKQLFFSRMFMGAGVFLAIIFIFSLKFEVKFLSFLPKFVACVLAYSLIVQSYAYANAMKEQAQYARYRVELALQDFNKIVPAGEKFGFNSIFGADLRSPAAVTAAKTFPIIAQSDIFNINWLYWAYDLHKWHEVWAPGLCMQEGKKEVKRIQTPLHTLIRYDNNCVSIIFTPLQG